VRVPSLVAPRYNPEPSLKRSISGRGRLGQRQKRTCQRVPVSGSDRTRRRGATSASTRYNPVAITVHLTAGFPPRCQKAIISAVKDRCAERRCAAYNAATTTVRRPIAATSSWMDAGRAAAQSVGLFREHVGNADYLSSW